MNVNAEADAIFASIDMDNLDSMSSIDLTREIDKINAIFQTPARLAGLTPDRAARLDAIRAILGMVLNDLERSGRLSPSPAAGGRRAKKSRSRRRTKKSRSRR